MPHNSSAVVAGLLGALFGALLISFIVIRAARKFTGRSRKGVIRACAVGLIVGWGLRIAVWLGLDGGFGNILPDLFVYAAATAFWFIHDYRKSEA